MAFKLTEQQKQFIDNNYGTKKPREMAASLAISVDHVRDYMGRKGLQSICTKNRKDSSPLTEGDKEFIRANSAKMTINRMKEQTTCNSYHHVKRFLVKEKLPVKIQRRELRDPTIPSEIKHKVIPAYSRRDQVQIKRPPAVYSNTNWERYGQEILNRHV